MMKFPMHLSLSIDHNRHKCYYQSVEQSINDDEHGYDFWVSEDQKQKAIETDECWLIQIYPKTPIGSYTVASCDLDALLDYVSKLDIE